MTVRITRRSFAATGAAGLVSGSRANAAPGPIDKLSLYQRARGTSDGTRSVIWYQGRLWGQRPLQAAKTFFDVHGLSFNEIKTTDDGGLLQRMVEVGFWLDPATKQPADAWTNPYNGLVCKPQHYRSTQVVKFASTGAITPIQETPGTVMSGAINEPTIGQEMVWISEDLLMESVRMPGAGQQGNTDLSMNVAPLRVTTALVTFTVRAADLAKSATAFLPATMNFQSILNWYPWMRMGHELGGCMFQLHGQKVRKLSDVPPSILQLVNERRPGFIEDPGL
jgi:hypothetical protein